MNIDVSKIIMEQALAGIHSETLNEAGEALYGEEYLIAAINEYIDLPNPGFTLGEVLTESVSFSDNFSQYVPLLEAVDTIKAAEGELEKAEETDDPTVFEKVAAAIKKIVTWWYKIDPDTKAKNFRTVSRVIWKVAMYALKWKYGTAGMAFGDLAGKVAGKVTKGKVSFNADTTVKGKKIFGNGSAGTVDVTKVKKSGETVVKTKRLISKKCLLIDVAISALDMVVSKINDEVYYRINKDDVDDAIKKYDKIVDQFNEALDEETDPELVASLKKGKKKTEDALRDLIKVRDERDKRAAQKEAIDEMKAEFASTKKAEIKA